MFDFTGKVAVVTGGARGIGKCIRQHFEQAGAKVCVIDLLENDCFVGDLSSKDTLERFAAQVIAEHGHIDYLINNAAPKFCGIQKASYEDFEYALKVGVTAPFYLSKLFAPYFAPGASIVNISSSRDRMKPAPERELYRRQGRHRSPDPRPGGEPGGQGKGKFHLPGLDRQRL